MQNKGAIVFLTVIITALCLYYLSFTFISNGVQEKATAYATDASGNIDFAKKSFQTDLKLEALGQTVQIGAVGKVEEGGVLRSNSFTSTTAVQGLVGGNGGKQAVYIYRQPGSVGLELSGAAVWNR